MTSFNSNGAEKCLLAQLKQFDKKSLSKTVTSIKTEGGRVMRETHDDYGNYKATVESASQPGFVPDLNLDLQVGQIKSNLLMGNINTSELWVGFARAIPNLGSQDVAAEWDILQKYGITHIVNVATYIKNYFPEKIKYLNRNVLDICDFNILPFFPSVFDFIDEGRKTGCVFVHCNAGVSRSATFIIGYLMKTEKITFKVALEYVKSKRPKTCPNEGFQAQLKIYEKKLSLS